MKLDTLFLSFSLSHLAWCKPIILADSLEDVPRSLAAHPPAPVASSRPKHALPQTTFLDSTDAHIIQDEDEEQEIDNGPVTPSRTDQPSAVLAMDKPVSTKYLLALARGGSGRGPPASHAPEVSDEDTKAIEASSIAQIETGTVVGSADAPAEMPSYYPSVTMSRGDMLLMGSVAIFLSLVVVVELLPKLARR